ncbi:hypothetical protein B0O80DRAFT_187047 [Mortierella sp. GBAus27b]|nr:hypothetical protein B0O80DRAFT_187047 [Mortierella sp. GBAus27b]
MSLTALNHPLQLPEIITVIGQHLDIPDLIRCLRVCSSWQASFLPFAWCSVSIQSAKPNPTVEALSRYRQHIKDLSYHDGVWQEYISIFCPNLRQLPSTAPMTLSLASMNSSAHSGCMVRNVHHPDSPF